MRQRIISFVVLVLIMWALVQLPAQQPVNQASVCPVGTYPTTISIKTATAKAEGVLCGDYALEQLVGHIRWQEDFRVLLESKGFTVADTDRWTEGR
jgi:hypothetical protein